MQPIQIQIGDLIAKSPDEPQPVSYTHLDVYKRQEKSIEKYGGDKMFFAPPIDYDKVMRLVPCGKLLTVGTISDYFAKQSGADFTEPITAGIFVSIVAWASYPVSYTHLDVYKRQPFTEPMYSISYPASLSAGIRAIFGVT